MPLVLIRDDISRVDADAVVNAANEHLSVGGGVCGAIFDAAGRRELESACRRLGGCPTGSAVVTPGFGLKARWIIHAVGPIWRGGSWGEEALLRSAYRSALERARELEVRSVALPLISAGIFGFPIDRALAIATGEISAFLDRSHDIEVRLVVFDRSAFAAGLADYGEVAAYVDEEYVEARHGRDRMGDLRSSMPVCGVVADAASDDAVRGGPRFAPAQGAVDERELENMLVHLDQSFSQAVLSLIDERGLTDAAVYKRANLSRQLFSKLRKDDGYRPAKPTAVALAIALELDMDQTRDLLQRAGYALSTASTFDAIVRYYIERGSYDIVAINQMLFAFDQPLLGSF